MMASPSPPPPPANLDRIDGFDGDVRFEERRAHVGQGVGDSRANLRLQKIGKRDGDQDQNDGDNDEQFDKGESITMVWAEVLGHVGIS